MKRFAPFLFAIVATLFAVGLSAALIRARSVEPQGWQATLDRWLQRVGEREPENLEAAE